MFAIFNYIHAHFLFKNIRFLCIDKVKVVGQVIYVSWQDELNDLHCTRFHANCIKNLSELPFEFVDRTSNRVEIFINKRYKSLLIPAFNYLFPDFPVSLGVFASSTSHLDIYINLIRYIIEIRHNKPIFYFAQRKALHSDCKQWLQELTHNNSQYISTQYKVYLEKIIKAFEYADYKQLMDISNDLEYDRNVSYAFICKVRQSIDRGLLLLCRLEVPIKSLAVMQRILDLTGFITELQRDKLYIRKEDETLAQVDLHHTPQWLVLQVAKYY